MSEFVWKFVKIIIAIIIPNVGGVIGSRGVIGNFDWYDKLKKPLLNPPKWLFAPAWTLLYSLMGFASYLVYEELMAKNEGWNSTAVISLGLFVIQLIFNWLWSPIFFNYHLLGWSVVDILANLISAAANGYVFYTINRTAGLLFIPYILWLCYATYLDVSIYLLNKDHIIEATTIERAR